MDREKVVKGLNNISREIINTIGHGEAIPYLRTIDDAISLLKEQEAVEPEMEGGGSSWWYVCGECHGAIDPHDGFCRHCGREIKKKTACDGCNYKGSEDCPIGTPGWENAFCPNGKL